MEGVFWNVSQDVLSLCTKSCTFLQSGRSYKVIPNASTPVARLAKNTVTESAATTVFSLSNFHCLKGKMYQ